MLYWSLYCVFSLDTLFFNGINRKFRLLFLLVLLIGSLLLSEWFHQIFTLKNAYRRRVTLSILLQMLLMLALFLIVFPGSWSWDDVAVLEYAKDYRFHGFQHFLTSLYLILCLYFIPSAAGATAMQAILLSVLSGWVIVKVEDGYLEGLSLFGKLLLRPAFFLPPILFHNYLFFRNVVCAYTELALLVYAAVAARRSLRWKDLFLLSGFTALLASWRSENIYYLPFFFLYLIFAGRKKKEKKTDEPSGCSSLRQSGFRQLSVRLLIFMLVCGLVLSVGKYNNHVIGSNNYSVLTSACPGLALYREARTEPERNEKELAAIEKVLNEETIDANPDAGGAQLYWMSDFVNSYTDGEYSDYLLAILRLIFRYPGTFLGERWKLFKDALGVNSEQVMYVKDTILMFREDPAFRETSGYASVTDEMPLFPELREKLMLFAGNLREDLSFTSAHYIVWNLIPPMLFLIIGCIVFFIRKWYPEAFCLFAVLCKIPILFLTEPASFFMYYISVYLIGYFLLFSALASRLQRKNLRKNL